MKTSADVVVISAGAIGCSTAYHLAKMGIDDVIVLGMDQVGSGTSSKSGVGLGKRYLSSIPPDVSWSPVQSQKYPLSPLLWRKSSQNGISAPKVRVY